MARSSTTFEKNHKPNPNRRKRGKGKYSLAGLREQFDLSDSPSDMTFYDYLVARAIIDIETSSDSRVACLLVDMLLPDAV